MANGGLQTWVIPLSDGKKRPMWTLVLHRRFEIVPFSKINPNDYMTISIRGVTHYSNGELDYQDRCGC